MSQREATNNGELDPGAQRKTATDLDLEPWRMDDDGDDDGRIRSIPLINVKEMTNMGRQDGEDMLGGRRDNNTQSAAHILHGSDQLTEPMMKESNGDSSISIRTKSSGYSSHSADFDILPDHGSLANPKTRPKADHTVDSLSNNDVGYHNIYHLLRHARTDHLSSPRPSSSDHQDQQKPEGDSKGLSRIVIDGANVAMEHGLHQVYSCRGIEIVVKYFQHLGHESITVFVPTHGLRAVHRQTRDPHILIDLARRGVVVKTPSRKSPKGNIASYENRFILKLASTDKAIIVSNDQFKDLKNESSGFRETIENRILPFVFIDDTFHPAKDPLGRKGPILKQILPVTTEGFSTVQFLKPAAHYAAEQNNYQVMDCMLESMTDSSERLQLMNSRSMAGVTVLQRAVLHDNEQTVKSIKSHMTGDLWCQLLKAQDYTSNTALHHAAHNNSTGMMSTLLDTLADEQTLDLLRIGGSGGRTAKQEALSRGHTLLSALLEEITTTVMIRIFTVTADKDVKRSLREKLIDEPLTSHQVEELYPLSDKYLIPRNQKNIQQQAFVFYNEDDRQGAKSEADHVADAFNKGGCHVSSQVWSKVVELQSMISSSVTSVRDNCSIFIVCLMSHGSIGCLQGKDGMISINTVLKLISYSQLPEHIPVMIVVQACQVSRYGLPVTDRQRETDPAVATNKSVTAEEGKIDVKRPHTVLLQAAVTGEVAYRGDYTGALSAQISKADGKSDVHDMHTAAVREMEIQHGSEQTPRITSTLKRDLVLPGPMTEDVSTQPDQLALQQTQLHPHRVAVSTEKARLMKPISTTDPRYKMYYLLCGVFNEQAVRMVLNKYPQEMDANKITEAVLLLQQSKGKK